MNIANNLLWFLVAILILVSIHEWGHFWVARKLGVKVLRYSIGFGPVLFKRTAADGVEYAISAIPLGGYVKMLGEAGEEVAPEDAHRAFSAVAPWRRVLIVAAGPAANLILAVLLFWLVAWVGEPGLRAIVAPPAANSVAYAAGVRGGEIVTAVDGDDIQTFGQLRSALLDASVSRRPLQLRLQAGLDDSSTREVALDLSTVRVDPQYLFDDLGLHPIEPKLPAVLDQIMPGSAAEKAGLKAGDQILKVDDWQVEHFGHMAEWIRKHPGQTVQLTVQRGGDQFVRTAIISTEIEDGQRIGRLGMGVQRMSRKEVSRYLATPQLAPWPALKQGFEQVRVFSVVTLKLLLKMVTGEVSLKNVSGPVSIAQAAGFTASVGWITFVNFLGMVSVSIAVLNLLPIPVLDGGHILIHGFEMLTGRPLPELVQRAGLYAGFAFLMMLMGLAFYNDLSPFFGWR